MFPDCRDVARNRPPSPDLPCIVRGSAAHVKPAVPLKPSAWILGTDPTVSAPHRERLRCVDAETIQTRIAPLRTQLRTGKPARGELAAAVGHVFAAEHTKAQHLLRRQFRREPRGEV